MADFKWPLDDFGNRRSIPHFSDIDKVRYQVHLARVECTLQGDRHIREEILYLQNWSMYFHALTQHGEFDPEALKFMQMEIVRLFKEKDGWH